MLPTLGVETESLWDSMGDDHIAGGRLGIRGRAVFHMRSISVGGQATHLVDEVAEGVLHVRGFRCEGAGGYDGASLLIPEDLEAGGGLVSIVITAVALVPRKP